MQVKKYLSLLAASLFVVGFVVALPVLAQANPGFGKGVNRGGQMQGQGVVGTVSAVSGNIITIIGKQGFNNANIAAAKTFTVDATNAKITKNNVASTITGIAVGDTVIVQGTVNGTNITATIVRDGVMMGGARGVNGQGISGTVASINGTTLAITSKARMNKGAVTTYTVDASSATVTKNGAASSVSSIATGDTVMVQGTVIGTSVVAKTIRDGIPQAQPEIQGNGQPVIAGSVTVINGSTITITNKSNVTYTIDASNAKFVINGITSPTVSNVAVGDNLVIQGTVNGNTVTASSVIDQKAKANDGSNNSSESPKTKPGFMGGMMNGIGSFFKHLFGF
jgi:hypothetical protein